jgi:hypothetical protein
MFTLRRNKVKPVRLIATTSPFFSISSYIIRQVWLTEESFLVDVVVVNETTNTFLNEYQKEAIIA